MRCLSIVSMAVCAAVVLAACGPRTEPPASPPPTLALPASPAAAGSVAAEAKEYAIRGRVEGVAADRRAVTLDHEEIPGFMAAMKMEYRVSDSTVLEGLAAGDRVSGTLRVRGADQEIVALQRAGAASPGGRP